MTIQVGAHCHVRDTTNEWTWVHISAVPFAMYMSYDLSSSGTEGQGQRSTSTRSVGPRYCIEDNVLVAKLPCKQRVQIMLHIRLVCRIKYFLAVNKCLHAMVGVLLEGRFVRCPGSAPVYDDSNRWMLMRQKCSNFCATLSPEAICSAMPLIAAINQHTLIQLPNALPPGVNSGV